MTGVSRSVWEKTRRATAMALLALSLVVMAQGCAHRSAVEARTGTSSLVAFSLRRAEAICRAMQGEDPAVRELGRIERLLGVVYDPARQDVILVGRTGESGASMRLDDLVVAIRAMRRNQWPLVSIDPTAQTPMNGKQQVRMEGGIEDSQFGLDLLAVDVWLKRLALGTVVPRAQPGLGASLVSYFDLRARAAQSDLSLRNGASRFWFRVLDGNVDEREGVFAFHDLSIGVETEQLGRADAPAPAAHDAAAERFAKALTTSYGRFEAEFPVVARLRPLYQTVAAAEAMRRLPGLDLSYWATEYSALTARTPREFVLERREERVLTASGQQTLQISGGIQLKSLIIRLREGDVTALRDAVLLSKPDPQSLSWSIPLKTWDMDGEPYEEDARAVFAAKLGSRLQWELRPTQGAAGSGPAYAPLDLPPDGSLIRSPQPQRGVAADEQDGAHDRGGISADIQITTDDFKTMPKSSSRARP